GAPAPLARAEAADYRARLAALLRGAVPAPRALAGDDGLVFVEWEGSIPSGAGSYAFAMVDRFDLVDGRILAARSYFDAAALAAALAT
ncbi:MAG: nuclear transport factor 2 family protein, partial [Thermodesulfobacteriota bacterium]